MKNVWVISRREFRTYLTSPMSYVVTATFLALSGTFFSTYLAVTEYADASIRGFLNASQILILLFAAVLTMRSIAEEKKLGTWELLLTFPLTNAEIVFGKYLGSFAVFVGMLGLTLYYPILLFVFGDPDLGPIFTSYLWLVMLGAASLSVGVFASSVSSNQIVSVVISGGILFALAFLGLMAEFVPGGAEISWRIFLSPDTSASLWSV